MVHSGRNLCGSRHQTCVVQWDINEPLWFKGGVLKLHLPNLREFEEELDSDHRTLVHSRWSCIFYFSLPNRLGLRGSVDWDHGKPSLCGKVASPFPVAFLVYGGFLPLGFSPCRGFNAPGMNSRYFTFVVYYLCGYDLRGPGGVMKCPLCGGNL